MKFGFEFKLLQKEKRLWDFYTTIQRKNVCTLVNRDKQGFGIGTELLKYLKRKEKGNSFKFIEVETLTNKEERIGIFRF